MYCNDFCHKTHCVKGARIRSYSGLLFPAFGLNTDRPSVSLRIQSECEKMWPIITLNTDTSHAVTCFYAIVVTKLYPGYNSNAGNTSESYKCVYLRLD